jgi:CRP-like cAMP-binding protein
MEAVNTELNTTADDVELTNVQTASLESSSPSPGPGPASAATVASAAEQYENNTPVQSPIHSDRQLSSNITTPGPAPQPRRRLSVSRSDGVGAQVPAGPDSKPLLDERLSSGSSISGLAAGGTAGGAAGGGSGTGVTSSDSLAYAHYMMTDSDRIPSLIRDNSVSSSLRDKVAEMRRTIPSSHSTLNASIITEEDNNASKCCTWHPLDVISHTSHFLHIWDQIMAILILYTLIIVPLEIAFDPMSESTSLLLDLLVTFGFFCNIVIQFRVTVEKTHHIVSDSAGIAKHYMKKWFWLDLVATIPFDLITRKWFGAEGNALDLARMLRLFRLVRLLDGNQFSLAYFSDNAFRLIKMLSYAVAIAHWLGCAWYYLSESEGFAPEQFQPALGRGILATVDLADESLSYRYLISLHWGLWGMLSMGSELRPDSAWQAWLCIATICCGVAVFAAILGNIEVLLQQSAAGSLRFREHIQSLQDFFRHNDIPRSLQDAVLRHTHHVFRQRRGHDERELLALLPTETRNRVYRALYYNELLKCPFFSECEPGFINELCQSVRPQIALPGDLIIRQATLGSEMYIIHVGTAEAIDVRTDEVHSEIPEGRFFGEIALFTNALRSVSVRARTYMELFVLDKHDFLEAVKQFPDEKKRFVDVAHKRLAVTESIEYELERKHTRHNVWDVSTIEEMFDSNEELQRALDAKDAQDFVRKFDTNSDGVLDEAEREKILSFVKARKRQLSKITGESSGALIDPSQCTYSNTDTDSDDDNGNGDDRKEQAVAVTGNGHSGGDGDGDQQAIVADIGRKMAELQQLYARLSGSTKK